MDPLKIDVIGDYMVDVYENFSCTRISPEVPVPVLQYGTSSKFLGGAANVARNLAEFDGVSLRCHGVVGNDENGLWIKDQFMRLGIKDHTKISEYNASITKRRLLANGHPICRIDCDGGAENYVADFRERPDAIIISDYGKGTFGCVSAATLTASKAGAKVFVDPKSENFGIYTGAFCLKPNLKELEVATGNCSSIDEIVATCKTLIDRHCIENVVVTLGAKGSLHVDRQSHTLVPVKNVAVYNLTGAGDTMLAALTVKIMKGAGWENALTYANACSAYVVTKDVTTFVPNDQLRKFE